MTYYKHSDGGYIVGLQMSSAPSGGNIDEPEYNTILKKIQNKPTDPEGYAYKLRADTLEWVLVELPPVPSEDEIEVTAADYEAALREVGVNV